MQIRTAVVGVAAVWAMVGTLALAQDATHGGDMPRDADAHKALMDDAGDAQDDLRDLLAGKDAAKAAAAARKLETLLAQTERYWAAKHAEDIVKIAKASETLAQQVATAAKAGKFDAAREAFGKLGTTCNTCHDLHPEKR